MLASLNQGHVNLRPHIPASKMVFEALPLTFYVSPGKDIYRPAGAGYEDLIGSELTKIEDTPSIDALRQIKEIHASDSGMEVLWLGPWDLALAQELKGLGTVQRTDKIEITIRDRSGAIASRVLTTTSLGGGPKLRAVPARLR